MAMGTSSPAREKNVQDWINLVCGVLLFISPWALRFSGDPVAARTAWVGGIVIGVMAIAALVQFAEWEEWVALVVGLAVAVAPSVFGFAAMLYAVAALRGARSHRRARFDLGNLGRPSSRDHGQVSCHDGGSPASSERSASSSPARLSLDAVGAFGVVRGTPRYRSWSL